MGRREPRDTEITLGAGKMLVLFFGLVSVCGVFFGLGFTMGHNSEKAKVDLLQGASPVPVAATKKESPSATMKAVSSVTTPDTDSNPASDEKPEAADAAQAQPEQRPEPIRPVPVLGSGYVVQVAAVSKEEDADALVSSLKKKQYAVFLADSKSQDSLFHIQIGPFGDLKEAEAMKNRLAGDGYNAIVKR